MILQMIGFVFAVFILSLFKFGEWWNSTFEGFGDYVRTNLNKGFDYAERLIDGKEK